MLFSYIALKLFLSYGPLHSDYKVDLSFVCGISFEGSVPCNVLAPIKPRHHDRDGRLLGVLSNHWSQFLHDRPILARP